MNNDPIPAPQFPVHDTILSILDRFPRTTALISAVGITAMAVAGCSPGTPANKESTSSTPVFTPEATPPADTAAPAETDGGNEYTDLRNPVFAARAAQVISTFENSTTEVQYGYAENIDDGRGITAGRAGFCTGSDCYGDLLQVVQTYSEKAPGNLLEKYIPALENAEENDTTEGLDELPSDWGSAAEDPLMRQSQDEVFAEIYFDPSFKYAQEAGITSAAGQLVLLDTIIQHGEGDANEEVDGLPSMFNEVMSAQGPANGNEQEWLIGFLENRREHLENAADPDTREAWRESVSRVDALISIVNTDLTMTKALGWEVYGDRFQIEAIS